MFRGLMRDALVSACLPPHLHRTCVCGTAHVCVRVCVWMDVCVCCMCMTRIHTYTHKYTNTYIYTHTHTNTNTRTNTLTNAHTHTHTHKDKMDATVCTLCVYMGRGKRQEEEGGDMHMDLNPYVCQSIFM